MREIFRLETNRCQAQGIFCNRLETIDSDGFL